MGRLMKQGRGSGRPRTQERLRQETTVSGGAEELGLQRGSWSDRAGTFAFRETEILGTGMWKGGLCRGGRGCRRKITEEPDETRGRRR